jgi:hypothetical protein
MFVLTSMVAPGATTVLVSAHADDLVGATASEIPINATSPIRPKNVFIMEFWFCVLRFLISAFQPSGLSAFQRFSFSAFRLQRPHQTKAPPACISRRGKSRSFVVGTRSTASPMKNPKPGGLGLSD